MALCNGRGFSAEKKSRLAHQKKFTVDFLTKKQKVNEGEIPQYYIEESHEAIIDPSEWDAVQDEIKRRKSIGRAYSGKSVLSAKIVCGDCGEWYGLKTWHSNDKYKTVIWQCNRKYDKDKPDCSTPHFTEAPSSRKSWLPAGDQARGFNPEKVTDIKHWG